MFLSWLDPFADFFGIPWWYVLLTASLGILAFRASRTYFKTEKSDDQGLKGFLGFLSHLSRFTEIYHWGLLRCLRALDGWVGEPLTELHQSRQHPGWRRWLGSNPWTGKTYDLCLRFAVFYPAAALLVTWLITNQGVLGEVILLDPALSWQRILLFATCVLVIGLLSYKDRLKGWKSWKSWLAVAAAIGVVGIDAVAVTFVSVFVIAVIGTSTSTFLVAFIVTLAVVLASVFALTGVFVLADIFFGDVFIFAFTVIAVFAVVFAAVFAFLYVKLIDRFPKTAPMVRGGFWCLVFLSYAGMLYSLESNVQSGNTWLLFLGVLPLLNVPLDWLSLGLTRGLLRALYWRVGKWYLRLGISVLDAVIAVGLMFVLVTVVIGSVSALNWAAIAGGGGPLIDLPHTLRAIENHPTDSAHYWVYFLFFSTLVPTVFHLGVALFGVFAALGEALDRVVTKVIRLRGRKGDGIDSWLTNTGPFWVALITAGFLILIGVIFSHGSIAVELLWCLGKALLSTAECLVALIGLTYPSG